MKVNVGFLLEWEVNMRKNEIISPNSSARPSVFSFFFCLTIENQLESTALLIFPHSGYGSL
jgi:hypothetical protein